MEIANARLKLDRYGSDIPLFNVTPAEALLLKESHSRNTGSNPVTFTELIGDIDRDNETERNRLNNKYGGLRIHTGNTAVRAIDKLFPGAGSKLPVTFKEAGFDFPKKIKAAESEDSEAEPAPRRGRPKKQAEEVPVESNS